MKEAGGALNDGLVDALVCGRTKVCRGGRSSDDGEVALSLRGRSGPRFLVDTGVGSSTSVSNI